MKDLAKQKKKSLYAHSEPVKRSVHPKSGKDVGSASTNKTARDGEQSIGENAFFIAFMQMKAALPVWKKMFGVSVEERTRAWDQLDALWDPLRSKYAWAVPDSRALSILRQFSPLVEIGAGKGYWASLLQARGADILPYDIRGCPDGWGEPGAITYKNDWWTRVHKGGPAMLKKKESAGRSLFLCYPDEDESIAVQCLAHFCGEYIIHVGELQVGAGTAGGVPQAPYGRTSSGEFQRQLSARFHPLLMANLKATLPYGRDCISVWRRTVFVPGRLHDKGSGSGDGGSDMNDDEEEDGEDTSASEEDEAGDGDSYADFNNQYFADFYEHEKMLSDKARMAFYHSVIAKGVSKGDIVVDVGTGSGILAAFASKAGAGYVYAIDHNENVATCAEEVAVHNGLRNVEFVVGSSKEFALPIQRGRDVDPDQLVPNMKLHKDFIKKSKVDVILHEQMGDCLFDEDMVANITDLRDRLLKPGGVIIPSCYDLYVEPVQLDDARNVPFIGQLTDVHGYDFSYLTSAAARTKFQVDTNRGYHHLRSSDPSLVHHYLCEPAPILSIDLHTVTEGTMARDLCFHKKVTKTGRIDGYAVYFRCRSGQQVLETGPHADNRACHWGYRILRSSGMLVKEHESFDVRLCVGRWADLNSWFWDQAKRSAKASGPSSQLLNAPMMQDAMKALLENASSKEGAAGNGESESESEEDEEQAGKSSAGKSSTSALRERERELDVQYAETDDKEWAFVPASERLPVDRAAPCLVHLLE